MTGLKEYIARHDRARRASGKAQRPRARLQMLEELADIQIFQAAGMNAVSVALPAGIDLELRTARMNAFCKTLAEFQDLDVYVVATCVGKEE